MSDSSRHVLELRNISKGFPGVQALQDVSLQLAQGEILALLGENGAGKSTLMKILSGVYQPDEGEILINGCAQVLDGYENATSAGIATVFQEFSLMPYLNAVENVFLGREVTNRLGLMRRRHMHEVVKGLFDRLGISLNLQVEIRLLSVAEQQFIEIAKALSVEAQVLILDEPTATLTPSEAGRLFQIMRKLKGQGTSIIFISHHLDEIEAICDRCVVLRDGRAVATRAISAVNVDQMVEMMVGRKIDRVFPTKTGTISAKIVLDIQNLQIHRNGPVNSFFLREGEILGFAGLVGSGRTETLMAVLGASHTHQKSVHVHGKLVVIKEPADALQAGLGILPESRKTEGLIQSFSVARNISLNNLGDYLYGHLFLNFRREHQAVEEIVTRVGIKASGIDVSVDTLSGGNQQKVVLARWLSHHVKILFFDEPTRGIDVGAKAEIYVLMRELTKRGFSIIMISSELPEVLGMSDRVAIFKQGVIVKTLEGSEVTPEEVVRYATVGVSVAA